MIGEEKINEVRERADIVEVISSYVSLKRAGANYQGLCPFHAEKTPSFNVSPARQIFHCFGCGVGGNVFSFLMRLEGLSFGQAVKAVGARYGIEVEDKPFDSRAQERARRRELLLRVNELAAEFYQNILFQSPEGKRGLEYLQRRGYGMETARHFRLGFAPDRWDALAAYLQGKGYDHEIGRQLGLLRPGKNDGRDRDFFRNRLMFPVVDSSGAVVAFGGRALADETPKYLNSPESPVYHKGRTLYGLGQARSAMSRAGEVIIVEGYFDLLAVAGAGFENVVATCGTALTTEHAVLLQRHGKKVALLFDGDSAGWKATLRAMEILLGTDVATTVITLEDGADPDSFIQEHGAQAFAERFAQARPVLEVFMEKTLREAGQERESRARAAESVAAKISLLASPVKRELYLRELAERVGVSVQALAMAGREMSAASRVTAMAPRQTREDIPLKNQQWLLRLLVLDGDLRQRLEAEGAERYFADPDYLMTAEQILACGADDKALADLLEGAELSENQRRIVREALQGDVASLTEDREKIFQDCCQATETQRLKKRSRELTREIVEAEKNGDIAAVAALSQEKLKIDRQLKTRNAAIAEKKVI
ncbi:MAG: DNA primase [Deltaproteobacteria bacterium]|nr:DNA primase [Deltaproteobacteria bacterium]